MDTIEKTSAPRIGDKAPDFEAVTTTGKDSWAILFSHPADFTPVCTTGMTDFAQEQKYFEKRGGGFLSG